KKRDIPWRRIGTNSTIQLGYGAFQQRFQATITCNTSAMATDAASDKERTKQLLAKAKIPVAKGGMCRDEEELFEIINKIGYPIVIKPVDANQGKGITINITNWDAAKTGLAAALEYSKYILVEEYIEGFDFRLLVIGGKFVAAAKRIPAHVKGDGLHTIAELIDRENKDPRRGDGH